jgi:hypothetical protein
MNLINSDMTRKNMITINGNPNSTSNIILFSFLKKNENFRKKKILVLFVKYKFVNLSHDKC